LLAPCSFGGAAIAGDRHWTQSSETGVTGDSDSGSTIVKVVPCPKPLLAAEMVPRLEASDDVFDLLTLRIVQARILVLRGAPQEAGWLEWLESTARETEDPQFLLSGLGAVALVQAGLSQDVAAAGLLTEVGISPGSRNTTEYAVMLPSMVRTALAIGEPSVAQALVGDLEPNAPYIEQALVTANAALTEARGDLQAAADAYADAAGRWERFGVVPEEAFALLGQGRCLIGLSRGPGASRALQRAREIFERLQAIPAVAETDALLMQATALSS